MKSQSSWTAEDGMGPAFVGGSPGQREPQTTEIKRQAWRWKQPDAEKVETMWNS